MSTAADHMKPWVVNEEDDFPENSDSDSDSETSGDRCQVRTAEFSIIKQKQEISGVEQGSGMADILDW